MRRSRAQLLSMNMFHALLMISLPSVSLVDIGIGGTRSFAVPVATCSHQTDIVLVGLSSSTLSSTSSVCPNLGVLPNLFLPPSDPLSEFRGVRLLGRLLPSCRTDSPFGCLLIRSDVSSCTRKHHLLPSSFLAFTSSPFPLPTPALHRNPPL